MKIKTLKQQYKILSRHFPDHKFTEPKKLPELPEHAEGWFLIPGLRGEYIPCLKYALDSISRQRKGRFLNWIADRMDKKYLGPCGKTSSESDGMIRAGDYRVVAAQFGNRWKGKSVEDVRKNLASNEFGLNSYEVVCMLLAHPERLEKPENLWIDCPGDELSSGAVGDFSDAPYFGFGVGGVRFGTGWVGNAYDRYGSASGFVSQSKIENRKLDAFESLNLNGEVMELGGTRYRLTKL